MNKLALDVRSEVMDKVEEVDPDVLVLGARGLGTIRGLLMGSVSQYCVRNAKIPGTSALPCVPCRALPCGAVRCAHARRTLSLSADRAAREGRHLEAREARKEQERERESEEHQPGRGE
jgi:hypothetical protein